MTKAIAYVASTLPIGLLHRHMEDFRIETIIMHENQLESYKYLVRLHPSVSIKILPKRHGIFYAIYLALILIKTKLFGHEIYFFHECCSPLFDLFLMVIKPCGHFYPQVTLRSFSNISY